ncbi:MAG TPA: FecR family protein [Burkholderiales bacterium]|nr:FecR family protein [Burkholderiales bacterium]
MKHIRWLIATAVVAAAASAQAAEIIGRVLVAAGDVRAIRDGREIPLQYTSPIEAGDRVRTGSASHAQIRLTDESIISLRPETEFAFTDYRYGGKEDGAERALFRLLKGGLRTITGLVGRRNHQNYRLETPTATIGIRGTHYVLVLCNQNCYNADGSRAPDGLYGNTTGFSFGTNRVSATNKTGEKIFGVNEPFHVPDFLAEPRRLIAPPDFLGDKLAGRERNRGKGAGDASAGQAAGAESDGRGIGSLPPPEALPAIATEQRDSSGQLAVLSTGASVIPSVGNGGASYFESASLSLVRSLADASLSTDAQGQLTTINDTGFTATRGSAGATDVGSNAAAGNLHWGMWPDAVINGSTVAPLHFIVGDTPSLPGTGVFTYSPVGGTRPTNAQGIAGTFVGGTVTVNFTLADLQLNNWQVAFNGAAYSGAGRTTFQSATFTGQMSWSCTGPTCGTSQNGNFAGSFTGAGAAGVGIVYGIQDTGTNGQIIGAQGFRR